MNEIPRHAAVAAEREAAAADPVGWYSRRSGEQVTYGSLIDDLTNSPEERIGLLHDYFEPTADDTQQGLKALVDVVCPDTDGDYEVDPVAAAVAP